MTLSLSNLAWRLRPRHWLMISASGIFILGALIYPLRTIVGGLDGVFFGSFSAFSHALFFVLAWAYPFKSKQGLITGSVVIGMIVTGFEVLQKPDVLSGLQGYLPDAVINYAKTGIYDPLDIAAGLLGILVAGLAALTLNGKRDTL